MGLSIDDKNKKKLEKQINQWSCINNFYKKFSHELFSYWLLLPIHGCYKPFFYWLHETATCCYSGVDLGNGFEHNSFSRSADGTPYSSSDLLTLPLPFSWTKLFKVQLPFSLLPLWTKNFLSPTPLLSWRNFSKSNSSSLSSWTKLF